MTVATSFSLAQEVKYIAPDRTMGRSLAVVVPDQPLVHTSQVAGGTAQEVFESLDRELKGAGASLSHVVKLNVYATEPSAQMEVHQAIRERFDAAKFPAVMFVVSKLPKEDAKIAIDAIATLSQAVALKKVTIPSATTSILPAGGVAYISGQAEKGSDLAESTKKTMQSLGRTLTFLGVDWSDVVHVKSFVVPMADHRMAQKEIASFFGSGPVPPSVFVEWISNGLPIEIEMVVSLPNSSSKVPIEYATPPDMKASPVYSRLSRFAGQTKIYTSGVSSEGTASEQVHAAFSQLKVALQSSGSDLLHLAKATYYVSADDVSKALNDIRPQYYDPNRPPAASKAVVHGIDGSKTTMVIDWIAVAK